MCLLVPPNLCACAQSLQSYLTPWTIAHQAPWSMGFLRQEYWNELPCPPPGDLPCPGIKLASPALQMDSLLLSHYFPQIFCAYKQSRVQWISVIMKELVLKLPGSRECLSISQSLSKEASRIGSEAPRKNKGS